MEMQEDAGWLENLKENYRVAIEERADPRTQEWFLVHSPWPPFIILVVYVIFCLNAKRLMKDRQPFQLHGLMFVYNFALVILSAYMAYEYFMSSYLARYNLYCQPVDYSNSPLAMRVCILYLLFLFLDRKYLIFSIFCIANVSWWYFISKYIELLDSLFFILRKKYSQISFLHVYHHSTMLINWWLSVKYVPGGQCFFIALLNSSVHVLMYSYYALSIFGPKVRKYLWWKKYLTRLQLVQFVAIFVHCGYNLSIECDFPRWLNKLVMGYMITLIILFLNFYIKSYMKKKTKSA